MNKKLRELLDQINGVKAEIVNLVNAGDTEGAKAKKEELKTLQDKFDLLSDVLDEEPVGGLNPTNDGVEGVKDEKDSTHEFAEAARNHFRNAYEGNRAGSNPDGGYTVPEDIKTRVNQYKQAITSKLEDLVTVESVTAPSGARTYQTRGKAQKFNTVAEAAAVGKLGGPKFERIEYSVEKRSGYLPVTEELLDDSDAGIAEILTKWLAEADVATKNALVLGKIDEFTATDLKDLDGIKKAINVTLGAAYAGAVRIVTNDDGLQYLDTLKDANGRYLLSPGVTDPMQMYLAVGARKIPVTVIENDTLQTKENKVPFEIGDFKEAIHIYDRKGYTLSTSDVATVGGVNAFEQGVTFFKGTERNDCRTVDKKALVHGYITVTAGE